MIKNRLGLLLSLIMLTSFTTPLEAMPLFFPRVEYAVGEAPFAIITDDFDQDSHPDIVTCNLDIEGTHLSLLIGNGDGTFQEQIIIQEHCSYALASGCMNNDDIPDLVISRYIDGINYVCILLGNGDGSFESDGCYAVGRTPVSIAVDDLDRNETLDLAVANSTNYISLDPVGSLSVLFGNGDGTFQEETNYEGVDYPSQVISGDIDADEYPDLAASNHYSDDVSIYLNNGDGSFEEAVHYNTGDDSYSLSFGYLNNDIYLDLVVANHYGYSISILLNDGDGSFHDAVNYFAHVPNIVVVRDIDQDGFTDIAASNQGINVVSILLGSGDGTFLDISDHMYDSGSYPQKMTSGDFDGNDFPDLAIANVYSEKISILINAGECWDIDEDWYLDQVCGGNDCDDNNAEVNPGKDEQPDNGIDDDCDGKVDEACFISFSL